MDPKVKRLVDHVKAYLHERYGDAIKRVILYGSHARGEATEDSDVDVLVLTDPSLKPAEVRKSLSILLFDMRIVGDYGVIRPVAREEAEDLLNAARDFVAKVKTWLDQWTKRNE